MCQLLSGHHEVWQRCGPIKRSLQSNRANKKNNRSNKKKPRRIVLPNCDDTLIEASSSSSSYTQTNRAPNVKMKNANPPLIGPRISAKLLFLFLFLFLSLIQCLQPKWAQAQARPSQIIFPQQQQQVSQLDSQQQQQQQQVSSNKLPQPSAARASGKQEQIRQKLFNLNEADENGIYLLGLFDIHSRPSASSPFGGGRGGWPFGCGPIDVDAGETSSRRPMQNMWAFLWAIDQVNQDETLLPGVKLGSLVLDTCSSELQTSQQLANLLHGHHEGQLPRAGQFAGLVADQRDWRSVEASASIASSVGLTTFVTQTRSTKLNEQTTGDQTTKLGPNVAAAPPPMDNLDGLAPLVRSNRQMDERLLGGLLGIGNMMTSSSGDNVAFAGQQLQGQQLRDIYNANQQPQPTMDGANLAPVMPPDDGRQEELRMIKMLPGNEMIADALASLCDQMKWDLISVIYDSSEPDLVDLHDELIRELFLRNTQLALDEQLNGAAGGAATARLPSASSELPTSTAADQYERILLALARKAQIGSRVVVSLLGIQSARKIQAKLNEIRNGSGTRKSGSLDAATLKQLNSLQWITITDREPYYSYPTDSLGVISVSSSSSLMPEFKHYYDHLKLVEKLPQMTPASSSSSSLNTLNRTTRELNEQPTESTARFQPNNKWWPEYMKAVMTRRREQLGELLADECAKWLEPTLSPLNERCRQLDLASLADLERLRPPLRAGKFAGGSPAPIRLGPSGSFKATLAGSNRDGLTTPKSADGNKLTRYLASGWDHNGMDVINSVLAIANGLESIRQTLCSNVTFGLCPEMRQLVVSNEAAASSLNGILESESEQQQRRATQQPSLSELVHEELMKLTFQLVDGQMFRLNQSPYSAVAAISAAERAPNIRPAAVAAAAADGDDLTLGLLASGFLPLVQEHSPRSTQLDAKLKFYNLRFLRQNSIGFVKFAQFSQEDGLTWQANQSQALHYSSIPSNFTDQTPIKEVKSSCTDETRCLMLSAFVGSSQSGGGKSSLSASSPSSSSSSSSHLNEEQLAAGFNSLFKLDHPLISAASQNSNLEEPKLSTRSGGASADLARVRTMRSRAKFLSVPISDPFQATEPIENSTSTNRMQPPSQQQQQQTQRARRFEVIVLLPLHKSTAKINKTTSGGDNNNSNNNNNEDAQLRLVHSCGGSNSSGHYHHFRLDESRSFQQLAALAYAQQLVNGHLQLPKAANQQQHQQQSNRALTMTTTANLSSASSGQQPQQKQPQAGNELVISVIDYCGQIDLVEPSLLALLRSRQQAAKLEQHDDRSSQLVAVVDFDSRVGRLVDSALASANASTSLLHLTIGRQAMEASEQQRQSSPSHTSHDEQRPATTRTLSHEPSRRHLRISLLPSKTKEIEALLSLIKLFPSWRLVHLIYTDSYEFRDEFVRRANEAGICVSKLIWVPQVESTIDERGSSGDEVIDDGEEDLELSGRLGATLEKTRQLFKRELYDFSQQHNPSDRRPPLDGDDGETRASQRDYDGLNSTRLLVVLASSSDATNRLILEAASQSMLDDYVWLTTHEWLKSVELPFERAAAEASAAHKVAQALPKHFLSTKMESFEGHHFKEYFSHLLPALHEPIPADWFDEFWQQHFKCRLPTSTGGGRTIRDNRPEPLCNYSQRLDWDKMRDVDDLVPYTIRAIESLHVALSGYTDTTTTTDKKSELVRLKELSRDFRLAFDLGTREIVGNSAPAGPSRQDPVSQSLVGFHIVHRLQQPSSRDSQDQQQQASSPGGGSRRTNSRQLPANDSTGLGQLVRVGLWRDHYQLKHGFKLALAPFGKRRSKNGGDTENNNKQDRSMESSALRALLNDRGSVLSMLETISADDGAAKQTSNANPNKQLDESVAEQEMNSIARSLERLAGIKSRCSNSETCGLCKRQIGLTMSLIAQEEARLEQRELRPSEPRATSGNSVLFGGIAGDSSRRQRLSSLDGPTLSNFDDEDEEEAEEEGGDNRFGTSEVPGHLKSSRPAKWMQAKAERRLQSQSGSLDEIQAAASSLFDSRTSQQVASDTRRAYRHYANQHHAQYQSGGGGGFFWPEAASGLRRHSGALLSVLSLIGVAFMAATMTYFYPNMLDSQAGDRALAGMAAASNGPQWRRVKKFNQSQRSTSSSQCNIMLDEDEELNRIMGQMRPDSFLASIMANIADYLMLTSLMMLYSINVAYLLPAASVGVCWLRRVGLTLSYTLLFGSILAKIQEIHRRRQLLGCFDGSRELDYDSTKKQSKRASKKASAQSLEPVEENVEIGFESLTFDNNNELQTGVSHDSNAIDFEGKNHAQQSVVMEANGHQQQAQQEPVDGKLPDEPPGGSLKLPLLLLLANLAASLVWLVKQPPEPTLYQHTCWHCASLARSPVLFLYEPLLSLIGPGLILAISWIWSIVLFNRASASDAQFVRAMKRLIMNQPLSFTQMQNPEYLRLKQKQLELGEQLRDSKLLVITTTLLVLLWASATLSIVSASQELLRSITAATGSGLAPTVASTYRQQLGQHAGDEGQSLVYANILSGAIVFMVLFVYRLNWLFSCFIAKKARKFNYDQISSSTSLAGVGGVANSSRRRPFRLFKMRRGSKNFSQDHHQQQQQLQNQHQPGSFTDPSGQQMNDANKGANQERLKLQHFSMTYGTYHSAGGGSTSSDGLSGARGPLQASHQLKDTHLQTPPPSTGEAGASGIKTKSKSLTTGQQAKSTSDGSKSRSIFKLRKSTTSRGSASSTKGGQAQPTTGTNGSNVGVASKLQRRQSNGSVASSQAKLMRRFSDFDLTDDDDDDDEIDEFSISSQHQSDTISCAMSVGSNSTSQLQGNDLYPIDCSIQLESQPAGVTATPAGTTTAATTTTTIASTGSNGGQQDQRHKLATVEL